MTSTLSQRLAAALEARGMTAADLIKALGLSKGAIYNILNGETRPDAMRAITAARITHHLGVRPDWLLQGKGPMDDSRLVGDARPVSEFGETVSHIPASAFRRVPVVGTASMGMDGFWDALEYPTGHGDGFFDFPTKDPDAYVLQVKGSSMHPAIRSGWYVLIEPNSPVEPGEYVMLTLADGRSTVKELLWHRNGEYTVEAASSGQRYVFDEADVEKAHAVKAILAPSGRQPSSPA